VYLNVRSFVIAIVLIGVIANVIPAARAVPYSISVKFDKAPLPAEIWQLRNGSADLVNVDSGKLCLKSSGTESTVLAYRFYPLRSGDRPAFGDFQASLKLDPGAQSAGMSFGLLSYGDNSSWRLWLDWRPVEHQARLRLVAAGKSVPTAWSPIETAAPTSLTLTRQGNIVEAAVVSNERTEVVGHWHGVLEPIVDFGIGAQSDGAPDGIASFTGLDVRALPKCPRRQRLNRIRESCCQAIASFSPKGVALPGGEYLGGYLWHPQDQPSVTVDIANVKQDVNPVRLKISVTDWLGSAD